MITQGTSLQDYDRAYINTRPKYEEYCNSGMVDIPWYTEKEVSHFENSERVDQE